MQMEALREKELAPESSFDENPYYGVGRVGHSVSEEEFFRQANKRREGKLDAGRTVRSGYAYDFDSTDQVPFSDFERAAKVKAELGDGRVEGLGNRPAYRVVKRAFDVVFSGLVLVCFSWLYLLIALIVKIDDPKGPVFFKQTRVGMNGREFQMLKFRSMCVDAEDKLASLQELNEKTGPVFKIADDPRITHVGKWLRKLSLDELPQFLNVFFGDIPLRILKMRPDFSKKKLGAFALPANEVRTDSAVFMQVEDVIRNYLLSLQKIATNFIRSCDNGHEFFAKRSFGTGCCSDNVGSASGLKSFVPVLPSSDADGCDFAYCEVAA